MNHPMNHNEQLLAGLFFHQRNITIAIAAIIKALPKDLINREVVRQNISSSPLFEGVAQNDAEVRADVEMLANQILGPE
jgi:hypothetical protein